MVFPDGLLAKYATIQIGQFKNPFNVDGIIEEPACVMRWLSPAGRFVATLFGDQRTISFWETRSMRRCGPDLEVESIVYSAAWSHSEGHIVIVLLDGILRTWSNISESATIIAQSTQGHIGGSPEYSPDDNLIASVGNDTVKLWDASSLSLIWEYAGVGLSVAFRPLGYRVVFFGGRSVIDVNLEDLANISAIERKIDNWAFRLVFGRSGTTCAALTDQGAKILNAETFEERTSLPYDDVKALRYTPSGNCVLLVLQSKRVVLWDIAANAVVEELTLNLDFEILDAQVSESCDVLRLHSRNKPCIVHLTSI